jgi:hypothetical protein
MFGKKADDKIAKKQAEQEAIQMKLSHWKCHAHRLNRISFLCVRMKKSSAC